ncbi:MAG: DUF5719 family protein [Acidimicrobiales bacterium]
MRDRRAPMVVLLVVLLALSMIVDPRGSVEADQSAAVSAAALGPLATDADAGTSTWFCAGGSASGSGPAEHTVTVANPTDTDATGTLQLFVAGQEPVPFPLAVPAHQQQRVALSSLAVGEWASALVELDRGGLVVTHDVRGVGGWDSDRCSSQASDQWFFPWGRTTPQEASSLRLALFNPFAAEAVLDITFDTEDGYREPEILQGFLVPPRRLVMVDLTELVPVRQRISTQVKSRSGRLVVDAIQTLTGIDGTVTVDVTPGAPAPATSWYFAEGRADADTLERIAVFNPSESTAEVEVELGRPIDSPDLAIEPFELQIAPQSYGEVVINNESRVALPIRHTTVVRSLNGVGVVAERILASATVVPVAAGPAEFGPGGGPPVPVTDPSTAPTAPVPATNAPPSTNLAPAANVPPTGVAPLPLPPGLSATMGSPVVASAWVVPNASRPELVASKLVITNVALDQPVQLRVLAWGPGGIAQELDLRAALVPLEARRQIELLLPLGPQADLLVVVEASGPVVVEVVQSHGAPPDISVSGAVPRAGGVLVPDVLGVVIADLGSDSGFGTVVPSTVPPTSAPTTAPPTTAPVTAPPVTAPATSAAPVTTVPVTEPPAPPVTEPPASA